MRLFFTTSGFCPFEVARNIEPSHSKAQSQLRIYSEAEGTPLADARMTEKLLLYTWWNITSWFHCLMIGMVGEPVDCHPYKMQVLLLRFELPWKASIFEFIVHAIHCCSLMGLISSKKWGGSPWRLTCEKACWRGQFGFRIDYGTTI